MGLLRGSATPGRMSCHSWMEMVTSIIDDHDLDDIFYPGSDEEGFVLDNDTNEGGSDGGSEHSDSDQEDQEDLHR